MRVVHPDCLPEELQVAEVVAKGGGRPTKFVGEVPLARALDMLLKRTVC